MNAKMIIIVAAVIVALLIIVVVSGAFYIVDESQQAVITQFGRIIGDPITEPGLHIKAPFIQEANRFDKRLLDWEGEKTVSKTKEQKFISVEVYARWRITDPKLFLTTVAGRMETALSRLDAIIDPIVRDVIARYTLNELVRSDTEKPIIEKVLKGSMAAPSASLRDQSERESAEPPAETGETVEDLLSTEQDIYEERESWISQGRDKITGEIFEIAKEKVTQFGIDLVDVRVKRINYQPETRRQVYNRMIAERKREEALYISQGQQEAAEIQGRKDREIKLIQSKSEEAVLRILGEGEARAIETYAAAYNRDAAFYQFYKTLETLRQTLNKESILILSTDSEFYRILKDLGAIR